MKNVMSTVFLMTGEKILNGIHKIALNCAIFNGWHHYRDSKVFTNWKTPTRNYIPGSSTEEYMEDVRKDEI